MTVYRVLPYKMGSRSAKALADALDARLVFPNRRYRPRGDHVIINWGFGGEVRWSVGMPTGARLVNSPSAVSVASAKLRTFQRFDEGGVATVPFTPDKAVARGWLDAGHSVVARTLTRASGGRGIVLVDPGGDLPPAPLYTRYVKRRAEYRVHAMNGEVFDFTQKKRTYAEDEVDWCIRNHDRGWIFARLGVELPRAIPPLAVQAVASAGLDFGAVDVLDRSERSGGPLVLEINTACGLEGTTLERYARAIQENYS